MASILLLGGNATITARAKAAIESAGTHTVTSSTASTAAALTTAWGTGFDVIATAYVTPSADVAAFLSTKWAAGVPLLLGGPEGGSTTGTTTHFALSLGILGSAYSGNVFGASLLRVVAHPITAGYTPGSDVQVTAAGDGATILNNGVGGIAGTALGWAAGTVAQDRVFMVATETGDTLKTTGTAPARAVFCGWLYAFQTTYTTAGNDLLVKSVDWLTVAPGLNGIAAAVSGASGAITANLRAAGAAAATSGTTGAVRVNVRVAGQVDVISGASGALYTPPGVDHPVSGQVAAASGVQGAVTRQAVVSGTAAAVSDTTGRLAGTVDTGATISLGIALEVGALSLIDGVVLPGTTVTLGMGLTAGTSNAVNVLPGTSISLGLSLLTRTAPASGPEQWRYAVTDLSGMWLGDLSDLTHGPVDEAVNALTSMPFQVASDSLDRALIRTIDRKLQVWCGEQMLLFGPIIPGGPSAPGVESFEVVDPSWWWRDGRRVIGRIPMRNLLRNGDFRQGLNFWTGGYDADSIPAAPPASTVVDEDFVNDSDGLDPVKALQIVGTESVTETKAELQSSAVYWPNRPFAWEPLAAGFRPGGAAAVDAVADAMPTTPGLKVSIVGHTANDGTGNGMALSLRRAEAAKARVAAKRPGAVVTTKGVGYYQPDTRYPIDSQQQRRVVISYTSTVTVTAKAKQYRKQTVTVTQPKSARYPLELTVQALVKVADDWSVEDANMTTLRLVARRSGATVPWDDTLGEGTASLSDTDPVERWIPQTATVTIPADGRTYLVDVYLYAAAALTRYAEVGLYASELLYFWGVDQAEIAKGIMQHVQDPAMGHGDLGIETRTPLTGIRRDRTYAHSSRTPADTALYELTALNRGLDIDTITLPDNRIILATYYPRQGKVSGYELVQGGNVAAVSPETTRDVASSVIAQAQGLGSFRAEAYARDTAALGGLLLERVVTAEQDTPIYELAEGARAEVEWGRTTTTGWWLDVDPEAVREVDAAIGKGDTVRLVLDVPEPVDALVRVTRRQRRPGGLRLLVALEQGAS